MPSTSQIDQALKELGLTLPAAPPPVASYVPGVVSGNHVHTSGQLPFESGALVTTGRLGQGAGEVSLEEGRRLAEVCALNALAVVKEQIGDLSRVVRVVKITGFVASAPDFHDQPKVLNGASELVGKLFGDAGIHARSAVGVAALPLNAPVEVEMIVEFAPER